MKENKGLIDDLNKAKNQLRNLKKSFEAKRKNKGKVVKEQKKEESVNSDGVNFRRFNAIKKNTQEERQKINRSISAVNLNKEGKSSNHMKREKSEKLRHAKGEGFKSQKLLRKYSKNLLSQNKQLKKSNENLLEVYLKEINELQIVRNILFNILIETR